MNRELPLDNRTLRVALGRLHVAFSDVDALDDNPAFLRIYLEYLSSLALIVTADDNDVVVFPDMQLHVMQLCLSIDPCFHFSLI